MSDLFPKISIVTPVFNQAVYLEECILSILDQKYPNLEYIIVDGGSTDGTVDIIKKYSPFLAYWVSEKDAGIYHALQKGFEKSTGEIMGWLNSDDILHRKSLFSVADIFGKFREVDWLQGYPTVIDELGRIVFHRPHRFSKYSFYLKEYHDGIFIQQESTYWRRSLWKKTGAFISTSYKYAGDFELWMRFFLNSQLVCTNALIGAFRMRSTGQISTDFYQPYVSECDKIIDGEIAKFSAAELKSLQKIKKNYKIKEKYPVISGLLSVDSSFLKEQKAAFSVNFDLQDKSFELK